MFIAQNKVRMHDVDLAGVLYFPRQFRFAHDALEDFLETSGITFDKLFRKMAYAFVIVHAESDYYAPLHVGDQLVIQLTVEKIGTTSFIIGYKIYRDKELTGEARTVHVSLDAKMRKKIPIPEEFKKFLATHLK